MLDPQTQIVRPLRRNLGGILLTLGIAGLLLMPMASTASDSLTIHELNILKNAEEVAISPDSQTVAYAVEVPRRPFHGEDGEAWQELHIADPDGNSRVFIGGEVDISEISWRPKHNEITFVAKRGDDEHDALYAIHRQGGEAQKLLSVHSSIDKYSFSPDGERVAVIAKRAKSKALTDLEEKGFDQKIFEEDWLPKEVWITTLGGKAEPKRVEIQGSVSNVFWSPNGKQLALVVAPTSLVDDDLINKRIWIYDLASEGIAKVKNPGKLGDIAWSPDSQHLAFVSAADKNDPAAGRLTVVPKSGGTPRDLIPKLLGHISHLTWESEDRILFLSEEGVEVRLGSIDRDGNNERTLLPLGGPIWEEMSRAPNGDIALTGSTSEHPEEIFLLKTGSSDAKRLTHLNPGLEKVRFATQEVVRYKARDGLEIEGLLIRPRDEKEGQRYPLVLIVHGGPEAHYSNGWLNSYSRPAQPLAERGFAVFFPNYRASTSRGVEFSKLNHGDPAGKEFDDLVDGVDHLIDIGLVDRDRVGITGGSYGGYASAWGATYYSERFAASVMSVGISEKVSKFGTSDIPHELYQVHDLKWPWEDWDLARERSPIYYVEKSNTPILILHGEKDTRVHPSQSLTLHRYLKVLGKTVRLVLYPEEGHGNRRAAAQLDYSLRLMRWMTHYLQGPGGAPPAYELNYKAP